MCAIVSLGAPCWGLASGGCRTAFQLRHKEDELPFTGVFPGAQLVAAKFQFVGAFGQVGRIVDDAAAGEDVTGGGALLPGFDDAGGDNAWPGQDSRNAHDLSHSSHPHRQKSTFVIVLRVRMAIRVAGLVKK